MPIENEVTLQYKPLSDDQKLKVREAQFQLNNTKEQAQKRCQLGQPESDQCHRTGWSRERPD
jgi:hypothetical protein